MAHSSGISPASHSLSARIGLHLKSRLAAPWVRRLRRHARLIDDAPIGNLLVIAPHPDDESLGCGGLIALKRLRGERVHVVFLTSGENSLAGHPAVTPQALGSKRETEAVAALQVLGLSADSVEFLRAGDGRLGTAGNGIRAGLVANLARIIGDHHPTVITTTFRLDGHPDHEAAYSLTCEAALLAASTAQIWEYPLWSLWLLDGVQSRQADFQKFSKLDVGSVLRVKKAAIACHATQVAPVAPWRRPTLSTRFTNRLLNRYELFCCSR
jgi:LmbE family N-acetylglucosaminyl deacetylase